MNNIENIRNKINNIDYQILKLFEERLNLMPEIVNYKRNLQLPIYDEIREVEHMEELMNYTDEKNKALVRQLFTKIMNLSKEKQKEF